MHLKTHLTHVVQSDPSEGEAVGAVVPIEGAAALATWAPRFCVDVFEGPKALIGPDPAFLQPSARTFWSQSRREIEAEGCPEEEDESNRH